ncbi:Zinc finger CCHC domain-containing 8 [Gossypium australe]|uniref:Zinc finger CCHC domain-containing 8 n=1 Tax=Gossypium australe TaxID=47621 RepID=A0A5B6WH64_9ROSI|nr:Zinc finger CCHC domain-containing 8 [Gossypium australe]
MLHSRVSPGVEIELKSVCSTWSHTWACGWPCVIDSIQMNKLPIDKIWKHGAQEFWATIDDDAERAEFWLENTIRVFDELSCTPDECIKCVVSLLRDNAYH